MTDSTSQSVQDLASSEYPIARGLAWMHGAFFCIAVGVIGVSFWLRAEGPSSVYIPGSSFALPELCSAKRLFGLPCPGCGLTRSFISISHGQLTRAWNFNPASFFVYAFVLAQIPWNAMQYYLICKRGYGISIIGFQFLPAIVAIVLLVTWLVRLSYWQIL